MIRNYWKRITLVSTLTAGLSALVYNKYQYNKTCKAFAQVISSWSERRFGIDELGVSATVVYNPAYKTKYMDTLSCFLKASLIDYDVIKSFESEKLKKVNGNRVVIIIGNTSTLSSILTEILPQNNIHPTVCFIPFPVDSYPSFYDKETNTFDVLYNAVASVLFGSTHNLHLISYETMTNAGKPAVVVNSLKLGELSESQCLVIPWYLKPFAWYFKKQTLDVLGIHKKLFEVSYLLKGRCSFCSTPPSFLQKMLGLRSDEDGEICNCGKQWIQLEEIPRDIEVCLKDDCLVLLDKEKKEIVRSRCFRIVPIPDLRYMLIDNASVPATSIQVNSKKYSVKLLHLPKYIPKIETKTTESLNFIHPFQNFKPLSLS